MGPAGPSTRQSCTPWPWSDQSRRRANAESMGERRFPFVRNALETCDRDCRADLSSPVRPHKTVNLEREGARFEVQQQAIAPIGRGSWACSCLDSVIDPMSILSVIVLCVGIVFRFVQDALHEAISLAPSSWLVDGRKRFGWRRKKNKASLAELLGEDP